MQTKTSHSWKALQGHQVPLPEQFKVKGSYVSFDSLGFNPKEMPVYLEVLMMLGIGFALLTIPYFAVEIINKYLLLIK